MQPNMSFIGLFPLARSVNPSVKIRLQLLKKTYGLSVEHLEWDLPTSKLYVVVSVPAVTRYLNK